LYVCYCRGEIQWKNFIYMYSVEKSDNKFNYYKKIQKTFLA